MIICCSLLLFLFAFFCSDLWDALLLVEFVQVVQQSLPDPKRLARAILADDSRTTLNKNFSHSKCRVCSWAATCCDRISKLYTDCIWLRLITTVWGIWQGDFILTTCQNEDICAVRHETWHVSYWYVLCTVVGKQKQKCQPFAWPQASH